MNTRLKEFFKVHKGNQLYDLAITIYFYMQNGHGTKHVSMKLCPRRVRRRTCPDRNDIDRCGDLITIECHSLYTHIHITYIRSQVVACVSVIIEYSQLYY